MARKHSSEAFYALDDPLEAGGILGPDRAAEKGLAWHQTWLRLAIPLTRGEAACLWVLNLNQKI